jgi:hypothetical protein
MRSSISIPVCCAVFVLAIFETASFATVVTTFDTDLEGWLITGDNAFDWDSTGGNPGGCLDVNDLATGTHNYAVAPPRFLGDWSIATGADTITHDVFLINTSGGAHSTGTYVYRIAGPAGWATALNPEALYPPQSTWTTLKVSLDSSDWTIGSGAWTDILSDVTSLRINAEFVYGGEEVRMDNIGLSFSPVRIAPPCPASDFTEAGTGDWTFQGTSGASNPGSGGNGGGFCLISDNASYNSYAYAPSVFLGDWSTLDGAGYITIDLRILSRTGTNEGSAEFIRLSGGGNAAYVSLAPSALPAGSFAWETYVFPLVEAEWTLDLGTWASLLSEVEEIEIDLEFFTGAEQVGFDNFGRLADSCPAIDYPLVVVDPGVYDCGYHSLVGVTAIAMNPLDGELYGLYRNAVASGGGLYGVTGTSAGIRVAGYDRPAGLIFDTDGDAYISEDYAGVVNRLEWLGASSVWVTGFHSGDDDPAGMCLAPQGFNGPNVSDEDILVSDRGSGGADEIWVFSPDSSENERLLMPDPGNVDQFDLTAGPYATVYVADGLDANSLYTLDTLGTLTGFGLTSPIPSAVGIVYDDIDSCLYVTSSADRSVYRVDPRTGSVTLVASGFGAFFWCNLEIDPPTRKLWVADQSYGRVYELCLQAESGIGPEARQHHPDSELSVLPNPSSAGTDLRFHLGKPSRVNVTVYDSRGLFVRRVMEADLPAGMHRVTWNGLDSEGRQVASGIYFVKLATGDRTLTSKVLVVK